MGIAIVTAATTLWLKVIGYLLPVLMTVSVVVTGNHYVLDVVAGIALALIGYAAALGLEQWRLRRRDRERGASRAAPEETTSPWSS